MKPIPSRPQVVQVPLQQLLKKAQTTVLVQVEWVASQVEALVIPQCLIISEAMGDRLAMAEALPILVVLTHHGDNLVQQVPRIRQAQVVQVQQVKRLTQDVLPHQTLLVKQVAQAQQILSLRQPAMVINQLLTLQH